MTHSRPKIRPFNSSNSPTVFNVKSLIAQGIGQMVKLQTTFTFAVFVHFFGLKSILWQHISSTSILTHYQNSWYIYILLINNNFLQMVDKSVKTSGSFKTDKVLVPIDPWIFNTNLIKWSDTFSWFAHCLSQFANYLFFFRLIGFDNRYLGPFDINCRSLSFVTKRVTGNYVPCWTRVEGWRRSKAVVRS